MHIYKNPATDKYIFSGTGKDGLYSPEKDGWEHIGQIPGKIRNFGSKRKEYTQTEMLQILTSEKMSLENAIVDLRSLMSKI